MQLLSSVVSSITNVCDAAASLGVTHDHPSDESRGVINDCNMFIIQATVACIINVLRS